MMTEEHKRNAIIASAWIVYGILSTPTNSLGLLIAWFGFSSVFVLRGDIR